jgi:hypothetical protein
MNFSQQRSMMQEHRSKPATHQPANTSKRAFNGEREAQPSHFSNFENVLNVVRLVEPKIHAYAQALVKVALNRL